MKLAYQYGCMLRSFIDSLCQPSYTDSPEHPDLSFPIPPNNITLRSLTDAITLPDTPSDTPQSPPNPILTLISTVRQQLLDHKSYREPFLKYLCIPYHGRQGTEQRQLRKIRPIKPTDSDVRHFFLSHWPEVHLKDHIGPYATANRLNNAICCHRWLASELVEKVTIGLSSYLFCYVDRRTFFFF